MQKDFPTIPSDRADDLHHLEHADSADLVLFMAGNQFMVMEEKRDRGTTLFTAIHHRETPLRIADKTADVGPVWVTKTVHAASTGLVFDVVEPGKDLDRRDHVNYYVCKLSGSPHPENAEKFQTFIRSSTAQKIYRKYGFVTPANT